MLNPLSNAWEKQATYWNPTVEFCKAKKHLYLYFLGISGFFTLTVTTLCTQADRSTILAVFLFSHQLTSLQLKTFKLLNLGESDWDRCELPYEVSFKCQETVNPNPTGKGVWRNRDCEAGWQDAWSKNCEPQGPLSSVLTFCTTLGVSFYICNMRDWNI